MHDGSRPFVIDAHTHAFPPDWVANRAPLLEQDRWFAELYRAPNARMVDCAELLATMDRAGVAQAVVCGWPWADPALCREHNDYLAEAAGTSGGRIAWLGIVAPAALGAGAEAERCLTLGARGIGELNADAQGFDLEDAMALADVTAALTLAGRPLMLHASEPVGHSYPGKGTATPDRLLAFIASQPQLPIVLAHWGGGLPFYELMPEVARISERVVYDTAASTYLYRPDVFRVVLELVGAERVLWGSDHPVLEMRRFLRRTLQEGLIPVGDQHLVLAENARRVYGLPELD